MSKIIAFLSAIEDARFNEDNEFQILECVICLESFKNGQRIKRIPTCKHFFHPECSDKWFKSKFMEDE